MSKFRFVRFNRLAVVACAAAALVAILPAAPAAASDLGCTREAGWAEINRAWADEVLALTNAHRATLGLSQLTLSTSLTKAAEWKAAHMATYNYLSHSDPAPPVDRSWDQRIEDCGYRYGMGENIAYGYRTPLAVVEGWLGSPGHRQNLEDPEYQVIGLGAAVDDEGTPYWAQVFGTFPMPADAETAEPVAEQPVEEEPAPAGDGWAESPVADAPVDEVDGGTEEASDDTTSSPFTSRRRQVLFRNPWRWRFGG